MTDPVMGLLAMLALIEESGGGRSGPPGPPGMPGGYAPAPAPGGGYGPMPGVPSSPTGPAHMPPPGDIGPGTIPSARPTPGPIIPGTSPPMPPWPTAPVPSDLPPFPGPGWCPDTPVTQAISQRAAYWNGLLWNFPSKTIRKPMVQEQFGGQWITFAAAWHPGNAGPRTYMATEAWRVCTQPSPAPPPPPAPGPSGGPLLQAAVAMNQALLAHGYKQADQPVYKAFQRAAGLGVDGFPGLHTMAMLTSVLAQAGQRIAPVKQYPWSSHGAYDGVNAPTMQEWAGGSAAPAPGSPGTMPGGFPAQVQPYPGPGAYANNGDYISRYQYALKWLAGISGNPSVDPGKVDGKFGPATKSAVAAFQAALVPPLPPDGKCGADTAKALDDAVASYAPHN